MSSRFRVHFTSNVRYRSPISDRYEIGLHQEFADVVGTGDIAGYRQPLGRGWAA